ncbi:MAG: dependent protein [Solirubrobacteraceae bacterium]|nr:dependent protein [Solirubrobacteraceae bacterium]MEA2394022.1 dependent protein [Solirubrobacteraceae bacterium]
MAELIRGLDARRVAANLDRVREEIGREDVAILAAVKYVAMEELGVLAEAGITLVGENRAQELEAKAAAHRELTWDFIGHLQSRKVRQIVPRARWIHSVASDSALEQLGRHGTDATEVLVEVNVAREEGKSGILPEELGAFLERSPVKVVGLMTMPPVAARPEDSRRWFAALAELAAERGLPELSMGTSQDYAVAAQEGATIVRLGTILYT